MAQEIVIQKEIISNQTNENGQPLVSLKKGDVVELKEDGIYFTRKIEFYSDANSGNDLKNHFKGISQENKK